MSKAKLKDRRGETLVEALAALLVVVLVLVFLPMAVTTAAKINAKAKDVSVTCSMSTDNPHDATMTIYYEDDVYSKVTDHLTVYEDDGYWFYRYDAPEPEEEEAEVESTGQETAEGDEDDE